jgi:hypothetical protein
MFSVAILVYSCTTVLVAGILFWRYKREPQKWVSFLSMLALWLMVPIVLVAAPPGWIPASRPGRPSWLSVIALALLVSAIAFELWRQPSRWRRYALLWGPLITALVFLQIVYPLVWER